MWGYGCARAFGGWGAWGGGGFMMIIPVLFWVGVISLMVWSFGRHRHAFQMAGDHSEAREIARRRYAKGEVSKDEFDQLMKDLY
jgi:putative membrane protein